MKKPDLSLIIMEGMKKKREGEQGDEYADDKLAIAEQLIAAVSDKNAEGVVDAFEALVHACQ